MEDRKTYICSFLKASWMLLNIDKKVHLCFRGQKGIRARCVTGLYENAFSIEGLQGKVKYIPSIDCFSLLLASGCTDYALRQSDQNT